MSHAFSRLAPHVSRPAARLLALSCALTAASVFAAPAAKIAYEPVAEGYPAYAGLTEANYLCGRHLCPSDLRHKQTALIYIDAAKFEEQLRATMPTVSAYNPNVNTWGASQETMVIARNSICLVVVVGKIDQKTVNDCIAKIAKDLTGGVPSWNIYANVSCSKAPDHGGKLPFYCVFGPEPGDPLASGDYDEAAIKKLAEIRKGKKNQPGDWKPYYGTIEEPKFMTKFAKTLASGKPLESLAAACQKGVTASDAEKAKECQILYDALEQTRSDYEFDIQTFGRGCPHRAFYEAQIVMKQWPSRKKVLKSALDRAKNIPDMQQLCKMYTQLKTWGAEDFKCKNAGEAKKIEAELKKMKVTCDTIIQKSTIAVVQSAAAWIGSEAENLAPQMASKVPVK